MRGLAREGAALTEVQELAEILGNAPAELDHWMRRAFVYRPESEEVVRTVPFMWRQFVSEYRIEGDCDDASVFLAAVLAAMGIPCRFVAIRWNGIPEFRHVFVEWFSRVAGRWIRFDVTVPPGTIHQEDERMIVNVL